MEHLELNIGHLHLTGARRGEHIHVTVRGIGPEGARPLLGTLTMSGSEWASLEIVIALQRESEQRRLKDMAEIARGDALLALARAQHEALRTRVETTQQWLAEKLTTAEGVQRELVMFADGLIKRIADNG